MFTIIFLVGCQANYIRDVQGGTVAPSSSSRLTGIDAK
ncbi:lysis protein for colicin E6 [Salmonella enterica]|uniref:Lysis protein for colicin n=1 Tax=Salmonella enterica subsp. houtenae serovar 45:g,z51:- TaxID=1967611 RepID=A0A736R8E3_SALHO|nr:lysis protein for colicin E6 [Salmonella enterica]ECG1391808.1 lysis protein for colicin E6 [Salmonella enterica subsp. houtenae str. CFSAN000557]HAE7767870.1 lysis protein for colicin E6 [Salmonella enterica subsp. houtenae serovar 45:g,z51:-]EAT2521872.1 lysis protein for colicin E6 [Salmonella enterica]EBH6331466.1 lysis protein for colicin E6 [Salmonella enterica]